MDKFQSERLESLKIQFYKIIGALELEKKIIISNFELKIFENNMNKCGTELEASSCVLGAIRRYKLLLTESSCADPVSGNAHNSELETPAPQLYLESDCNTEIDPLNYVETCMTQYLSNCENELDPLNHNKVSVSLPNSSTDIVSESQV